MRYFTLEGRELGPDYIHNLGCFKNLRMKKTKNKKQKTIALLNLASYCCPWI